MIKTILAHSGIDPRNDMRLDVAARLAAQFDARLVGLDVMPAEALPYYVSTYVPADVMLKIREEQQKTIARLATGFEEVTARHGVRAEWRAMAGDPVDLLPVHARYVDLTVVSGGSDGTYGDLVAPCVFDGGGPVLVLPQAGDVGAIGDRVLLAWNGSREAARAAHDAMPFLVRASNVLVQVIDPDGDNRLPGADIGAHLAEHGVKVEVEQARTAGIDVADVILNTVSDFRADLIVMGAYGRSRLREIVFGGTTYDVLESLTAPALLSH